MNINPKLPNQSKQKTLLISLAAFLNLGIVGAQGQASGEVADTDEGNIYELSPFVIDTSENVGYLATSTLAGTRIKTNLSDVGSAISVITQEVFKDTGATDAETILPYSLNVEVAGVQGNFADVSYSGANRVRSNSVVNNNQGATRVRGLSSALLTRGLFPTDIPFDAYNTSSVTINRGPNSLLFGASTPGGVIDQSLNQATFGEDFGSIEVRIGERQSHREVLDVNKMLVDNRLAIRISLLNDDFEYQQSPTFKHDRRAYAAINAVLFEGLDGGVLGRTTLRANMEVGDINSNPPKIVPPGDGLTDWFEGPSRSLEQFTGTTFPDWVDNFSPKRTLDNRDGKLRVGANQNVPFSAERPFFINMAMYYHQPDLQAPSMGIPGLEYVGGMPARTLWRGVGGRQTVDTYATFPFFGNSYSPGFTVPVLMDRNVFDNQNMAISGTMPYRNYNFDVQNIALEQELFDGKAGIEIAYDKQSYENEYYDPFSGAGFFGGNSFRGFDFRIDVMENLTNLKPNPNLGRVYMVDFNSPFFEDLVDRESNRITAFYDLDFTENEGFSKWLGRHVFTGFYSQDEVDREFRAIRNKWIDPPGSEWEVQTLVNDRLNGERRNVPMMVYLSDSLLGSDVQRMSDIRIKNFITVPVPQAGDLVVNHFHSFFNSPENTTGPAAPLEEGTFEVYRSLTNGNALRQTTDGKALSWQSFLFDGNLVGLLGWREDRFKTIENISLENFINEYPDAKGDGLLASGEFDGRRIRIADEGNPDHADQVSSVSNDTITWSLVGHMPENWINLPFGGNLSAHYNESETFVPTRTRRDFNGDVLQPETGETMEYGFTVQLLDQKLSVRVNWFELFQKNATAEGGPGAPLTGGLRFWKDAELLGIPFEDALRVGLDARPNLTPNITSYEQMYDAIIGLNPQRQQDLFNIRFGPDGRTVLVDPNPGQTIVTNAVAEGVEIDIVGNLTDNWRLMFNWGQQETTPSGTAPIAGEYVLALAENIESTGLSVVTAAPSLGEYNPYGNSARSAINSLNALRAKDGTVSLEQRKHRVNLLSTYSFSEDTRLKGLTVGGAIRWQSSVATGYETQAVDGVVIPIISKPFWGPDEMNGDVWISYQKPIRIFNAPLDWKIQLNVRNAIGDSDYIPVVTNPDGRVAVVRNPPTREWFLTNTIIF